MSRREVISLQRFRATALAAQNGGPHAPILYLHIPRTAGAALLGMLENLFGAARIRHLDAADPDIAQTLENIVAHELPNLACLVGDLPVYLVRPHLRRFRPFTLLRHPVARVFSLYRASGMREGFEAFITSRNPARYAQISNAMCRMLCGDPAVLDPETPLFWELETQLPILHRAVTALQTIDYGLADDMPATLAWLQAAWDIPYKLDPRITRATDYGGSEQDIRALQRVIALNQLDIGLYEHAAARFANHPTTPARDPVPPALFYPRPDQIIPIAEIPGRQGFHPPGADGVAWLRADRPARIHFLPPVATARLRLDITCTTADYPVGDISVSLNGVPVRLRRRADDVVSCTLESATLELMSEINVLTIDPPCFFSRPNTEDTPHYRSIGLRSVAFLS